ncbi:MAG: D-glucuronyl C5-epimerase family protein, partial [Gemmatimonadetes bacterium]|nr:D-glucuronyl C5-epimerase family protein [Gemmatimonadota bacterium]
SAYLGRRASHLTFWHGTPEVNEAANSQALDQYWQKFHAKADYAGPFDERGVPMLDYHGHVGVRHNPIAIAQYGLGNFNLWRDTGEEARRERFLTVADWLVDTLVPNEAGLHVWRHPFQWEYQTLLPHGWYSALSQGQGISLLARAHAVTGRAGYLEAARAAFETFFHEMEDGGVVHTDADGYVWFEEVILQPPTHILNGMMWASWGMYDLWLHTGDARAKERWETAVRTLADNLDRFEVGYWSLYDEAGTPLPNAASRFYHTLHVVQLRVMHALSGEARFAERAERWDRFQKGAVRRRLATAHKALFKLLYY